MKQKLNKETIETANRAVGEKIMKIRKEKGISQTELAFRCHTSVAQICETECGKYDMRIQTILAIAHGLETDIKNILPLETLDYLKSKIWI